ncbi:MAG: hypothetical protein KatS3mg111_1320 [Pirellulaceae bacterium]|nr:MAG: hypothetical protein KatS3mg111_1320 [Pirellulaceae bacterium]
MRFLRQHPRHQPFLLNLWFNACHAEDGDRRPGIGHYPWPQGVASLFGDTDMPPPRLSDPTIFESLPDFLKTTINRERYFWRWNTPYKYQENRRAYYRMVAGIDRAMKRILEELARLGLSENTIIVYSADNGYYLGNRGLAGKWSHYEESLHVPLIIVDPRVPKECQGQVTDAIALNLDLPATFLHWAGIDIPQSYQGHSLAPIVDGQVPRDWRTDSFHEHFAVRERIPAFEGVRTAHYKYVRYFDHGNYEFLHDLREDPDELRNLVADPRYREVLESLRERTDAYVAQYGGPLQPLETPFRSSTVPHPEAAALVGAKPDADGWVSLHDGRTLRGWVGDKRYWRVEDGAIVGRSDGSLESNTFLTWTFNTVQNFEFSVEVQISPEGNSGIQYRSHPRPDIHLHAVSGYQCDIVPNRSDYNGMIYEEGGRGMIVPAGKAMHIDASGNADQLHVLAQSAPANTTWTEYRIVAKANRLQHFVDGTLVAELIDDDPRHRRSEGVLAFQLHRGQPMEVRFRKPRLRHFPDSLPPDTPSPD